MIRALILVGLVSLAAAQSNAGGSLDDLIGDIFANPGPQLPTAVVNNNQRPPTQTQVRPPLPPTEHLRPVLGLNVS